VLVKYFLSSQCWYHLFSIACGSKFLESSMLKCSFIKWAKVQKGGDFLGRRF
jgi:hypothetical protein